MIDVVDVPVALVERYRTRAPRYTSYPTAPQFHAVDPAAVDAALAGGAGPMAAYVHIPFCRSLCSYCGCHVEIRTRRTVGAGYVDRVLAELDLVAARLRPGRTLAQLALGGGTPTFLEPEDMARLVRGLGARLPLAPGADVSIEIDPRTVDGAYLDLLVDLGFNRFSFGVQDLDPVVLDAVNRAQDAGLVWDALARLQARGSFDINLDLLYGLPHQTEVSFARTLESVVQMRPTRIALFHYAHVPWMKPAQKLVERAGLPDAATRAGLFSLAGRCLVDAGFVAIGMDHYALPGDALVAAAADGSLQRNFMGYTTRAGLDQIGLGVSAIGFFGGVYAQDLKDRDRWEAEIAGGALPVERGFVLSADDRERRAIIMDLFCNFRATFASRRFAPELERLAPLVRDGLVLPREDGLDVTPLGRHFIRNVCSVFDRYFESDPAQRRYSATA